MKLNCVTIIRGTIKARCSNNVSFFVWSMKELQLRVVEMNKWRRLETPYSPTLDP